MHRIGVLNFGGEAEFGRFVNAFSRGMADRGYQDGMNVRLDIRYSDLDREKLKRNARELAAANVDLIWVPGSTPAQAAREATAEIPIVFAIAPLEELLHRDATSRTSQDLLRGLRGHGRSLRPAVSRIAPRSCKSVDRRGNSAQTAGRARASEGR